MRWIKIAGLAAFCTVFGFVGSLGAVAVMGDELQGDQGPRGFTGPEGDEGPTGPPATTPSGAYVLVDRFGFTCPPGTTRPFAFTPRVATDDGRTMSLCRFD